MNKEIDMLSTEEKEAIAAAWEAGIVTAEGADERIGAGTYKIRIEKIATPRPNKPPA